MHLPPLAPLKTHWSLKISMLLAASVLATACAPGNTYAPDSIDAVAPHTGSDAIEDQYGALTTADIQPGRQVYVVSDRLRVRTSPEVKTDNIAGVLDLNDKVELMDTETYGPELFVAIRVVESKSGVPKNTVLYTSLKHLDGAPRKADPANPMASKIFVVTNLATEKVRVYLRCEPGEGCVNKMIFEQDVVNGEDEDGTRTDVGVFRVASWEKFYETPGKYPAWYKPGYPSVPSPGASLSSWFSNDYMPGGRGEMRGAFGWYTLKIAPNPNGQWLHGTAGWGKDKQRFIKFKTTTWGKFVNIFSSIRSHGCTRIDNESVAYLRSLVPVGATYVKIYAKEGTRFKTPVAHFPKKAEWPYIMTKNGGGILNNHQLADRDVVLNSGTPQSQWIEQGTLTADQYPNAVAFDTSKSNSEGGDLYDIGGRRFRGTFLVDEGTLVDYQHPSGLDVAGFSDRAMPSFMISNDRNFNMPESERNSYNNDDNGFTGTNSP